VKGKFVLLLLAFVLAGVAPAWAECWFFCGAAEAAKESLAESCDALSDPETKPLDYSLDGSLILSPAQRAKRGTNLFEAFGAGVSYGLSPDWRLFGRYGQSRTTVLEGQVETQARTLTVLGGGSFLTKLQGGSLLELSVGTGWAGADGETVFGPPLYLRAQWFPLPTLGVYYSILDLRAADSRQLGFGQLGVSFSLNLN